MRRLDLLILLVLAWSPLTAQMKYFVSTNAMVYHYGDSIHVTVGATNIGKVTDTLWLSDCDVAYSIDRYSMFGHYGHGPCPLTQAPNVFSPGDSLEWTYVPPFPVTKDSLAVGKHSVVGEIGGVLSDTLWITVSSLSAVDSILNFYPLHSGDYWQYKSLAENYYSGQPSLVRYYSVIVSGDTLLANGKRYFAIECSDTSRTYHPQFQRVDSTTFQVFAYDTSNGGREYQIDSLRAPYDSTFSGCRRSILLSTTVDTTGSAKYFGYNLTFRKYDSWTGSGPYILYTLAETLGLAYIQVGFDSAYDYYFYSDTLIYARIDGKEFGTFVTVVSQTPSIAKTFGLAQNYPNPFNPATTISYQLAVSSHVTLKVYDVLGREVAALVDENKTAGSYQAKFDGSRFASGVYFYRLEAGSYSATRRFVLMK
jgi:hypothetical protein